MPTIRLRCAIRASFRSLLLPVAADALHAASPQTSHKRIDTILAACDLAHGSGDRSSPSLPARCFTPGTLQAFTPASTQNIYHRAALALIGPDYSFRTTVEPTALSTPRKAHGDLVLVGRGDPIFPDVNFPTNLRTQRK